jgi:hypothetical protein
MLFGENESHFELSYESDDDLVVLMKRASNIVNSEQHRNIFELIFNIYGSCKDCNIRYEESGKLIVEIDYSSEKRPIDIYNAINPSDQVFGESLSYGVFIRSIGVWGEDPIDNYGDYLSGFIISTTTQDIAMIHMQLIP